MKKLAFLITLTLSGALFGQTPWWTSTDSVHVFSRNTGSVLVGSYEPLGKLTLGTDALNTSLALVGDYNNFAKNYLKIGVLGRSTDKMQGRAFFDLYHSNTNPKNVGYHFRINNKNLFYINAEGNVGIGTDQPQAGLDIQSAASWGSFKKGLRLAPDNALAIDAGTIKYGIVGNGDNLHFFTTNSDEKVSPFGNAFNKLMTFQPKKVVIEGDLEVRGNIIYAGGTFGGGSGGGGQTDGGGGTPSGEGSGGDIDPPKGYAGEGGGGGPLADSLWESGFYGVFTQWNNNSTSVGIGTTTPGAKLTVVSQGTGVGGSLDIESALGSLFWVREDGNIGINNTSPATKLHVNLSRTTTAYPSTSNADYQVTLQNTNNTTNNFNLINFADASASGIAQLGTITKSHTTHAGQLFFSTRPANGALAQRMLIDENGNIGIGTVTPGYKLDVNGTSRVSGAATFSSTSSFTGAATLSGGANFPGSGIWNTTGNVGIGTTTPSYKLDVLANNVLGLRVQNGTVSTGDVKSLHVVGTNPLTSFVSHALFVESGSGTASYAGYFGGRVTIGTPLPSGNSQLYISTSSATQIGLRIRGSASQSASLQEWQNSSGTVLATISSSGFVGIGTSNPTELLSVNGNIRTKKVIVTQQSWSDFVFDETYRLRPLSEVHEFIQTHSHLPDMPDQEEVADQGVDVGDMQAKLLQKIEELTLYVIDQDRRINDQQREIDTLRAHIK